MQTLAWIAKRGAVAAVTLLGASVLIFVAVRLMPGSYTDMILGPMASDEARSAAIERHGLDQSLFAQYWTWLSNLLHGDLGTSFVSGGDVSAEFAARLPVTVLITCGAAVLTVLIGVPLGIITAQRSKSAHGGSFGRIVSALGISVPEFVLGGLVVYVVSVLGLGFQIGGYQAAEQDFGAFIGSLVLPTFVLSIFCTAAMARTARDAVMGVLVEPHITASVARGEPKWFVVRHHVLRNSAIPMVTLMGTIIATLLGGAVIVESIFNVPGLGSYLVTALGRRDYAVIQAGVMLAAIAFIMSSLVIDLLAAAIDPRIKSRKGVSS